MKKNFVFIMLVVSLVFSAVEAYGQTTLSGTYTSDNKSNITFTGKNFTLVVESNNNSKFGVFSSLPRKGTFSISGSSLTLNISTYDDDPIIEKWTIVNANTLKDNRNIIYVKEGTSSNTTSQPAAPPANSQDFEMNGTTLVKYKGNATNVTIPNGVTHIGNRAFEGNKDIKSVTMPSSVYYIGDSTFTLCSSLTEIIIPDSLIGIGDYAFNSCSSLSRITIPKSVTNIGDYAFQRCNNLTAITVDTANTKFSSEDGILYDKRKTYLIRYPAGKNAVSFIIPNSVISIEPTAFEGCKRFTSITIPSSVKYIKTMAFENCTSLTSVIFQGIIDSSDFHSNAFYELGDLRNKYLTGGQGTYTTTSPVSKNSVWKKL